MATQTKTSLVLPISLIVGPSLLIVVATMTYLLANFVFGGPVDWTAPGRFSDSHHTPFNDFLSLLGTIGALAFIPSLVIGIILLERRRKARAALLTSAQPTAVPAQVMEGSAAQQASAVAPPPADTQNKLVGVNGWLAVFIVLLSIGTLQNLFQLLLYPGLFSGNKLASSFVPDYSAAMSPVLWYELISLLALIVGAIYLIVLITKHKQLAKKIAIIFLIAAPVLAVIDYAWVAFVIRDFSHRIEGALDQQIQVIVRSVLFAAIWVPYFIVSKRVKATLTK